jgi:hypothetical protein
MSVFRTEIQHLQRKDEAGDEYKKPIKIKLKIFLSWGHKPMHPGEKIFEGMIPILHPPPTSGDMIPGQLGPTKRDLLWLLST